MGDDKVDVYFYDEHGSVTTTIGTVIGVDYGKSEDFSIVWNTAGILTLTGKPEPKPARLPYGTLLRAKDGPFLGQEAMVIGSDKIIIGGVGTTLILDNWNPDYWEVVDE